MLPCCHVARQYSGSLLFGLRFRQVCGGGVPGLSVVSRVDLCGSKILLAVAIWQFWGIANGLQDASQDGVSDSVRRRLERAADSLRGTATATLFAFFGTIAFFVLMVVSTRIDTSYAEATHPPQIPQLENL